jgi:hypothetical protein
MCGLRAWVWGDSASVASRCGECGALLTVEIRIARINDDAG